MAEATYYFNSDGGPVGGKGGESWANPENMVDGEIDTFATTASTGDTELLDGNTCPADDLGTIRKVQLRLFGKGDGDDKIVLTPVFGGVNDGDPHDTFPVVDPGDWTSYVDITNDTNHPDWSTWSQIQALDCKVAFIKYGKANTMHCSKVEIRVIHWTPPIADIDVGAPPIDRETSWPGYTTFIDKNNPANASGTLHSVKVYADSNLTGLRVGTFYTTNGDTLKCRDSVDIGDVEAGAERTFTGLSITVEQGDYIGCYFYLGSIKMDGVGFEGVWYVPDEYIDPNDEAEYLTFAGSAISLYGYGDIVGVPEGTVYLVKATGRRTQLSVGAAAIRIDPSTGRRSLDTSLTKFLVREDDGTLRAKSA